MWRIAYDTAQSVDEELGLFEIGLATDFDLTNGWSIVEVKL